MKEVKGCPIKSDTFELFEKLQKVKECHNVAVVEFIHEDEMKVYRHTHFQRTYKTFSRRKTNLQI